MNDEVGSEGEEEEDRQNVSVDTKRALALFSAKVLGGVSPAAKKNVQSPTASPVKTSPNIQVKKSVAAVECPRATLAPFSISSSALKQVVIARTGHSEEKKKPSPIQSPSAKASHSTSSSASRSSPSSSAATDSGVKKSKTIKRQAPTVVVDANVGKKAKTIKRQAPTMVVDADDASVWSRLGGHV